MTRDPGRYLAAIRNLGWLLCVCLPTGAGCGTNAAPSVSLTLLSPHRDEIRAEVGWAFQDWFQQRSEQRAAELAHALRHWLEEGAGGDRSAVETAGRLLLDDWRPDDLPELHAVFSSWQREPSRPTGQALADALGQWQAAIPRAELIWRDIGGGTSAIARYISARYDAVGPSRGIGVDLVFGGGTDIYLRFAHEGLLEKMPLPEAIRRRIRPQLNGVPLYDPDGRWYGAMLSSFGILYNRWVLEQIGLPEPQQWADLGRPELQSWISAGDPRLSGSVHMVYEIILQSQGWERGMALLLRLGANTHSFIGDSGTLTRMVTLGEVAAAGNVDANAFVAVAREPRWIGYHLPAGETIINPDAIAVLRHPPRPQLARAFLEFILGDAGQKLFLLQVGQPGGPRQHPVSRLSVIEELYDRYPPAERSVGDANPFAVRHTLPYDSQRGNRRWNALNDLLGAVIVDAHPDLTAAWRAVLGSRLPEAPRRRLEAELFRPFCTEAELDEYARQVARQGPRERTEAVNRWGELARQRYRGIAAAARE